MSNNSSIKIVLAIGIIFLFIVSTVTPMVFGYMAISKTEEPVDEHYDFDRFVKHSFPETYIPDEDYLDILQNSFNADTFSESEITTKSSIKEIKEDDGESQISTSDGPMDSSWPMYGHDERHTGLSPYSTADNPYYEKWQFTLLGVSFHSAPVIDNDGTIYVGRGDIYAIYPNGTLKWKYDEINGWIQSAPAIDEDGVLYVGSQVAIPNYLYAIYTSNGTLKWKYDVGDDVDGSPVIDSDGTIYFSNWDGRIYALNSDGTLKWMCQTGDIVTSAPAIGLDGTIYCGSHDRYVYALYPNNGTVKWKYGTGDWVQGSPSIGSDGTVYIGSGDQFLYAFYPNNGTVKWKHGIGHIRGSPAIGEDGTLYVGVFQQEFYAVSPDGIRLWKYDAPGRIWFGTSAAISADGSIYFGTTEMDGGSGAFIILNTDGTERLNYQKGGFEFETSPAIGADGTVYVCSSYHGAVDFGLLHAFGKRDPNVPEAPIISGPTSGKPDVENEFTFKATSPVGRDLYYLIDFGEYQIVYNWIGPYASGEEITVKHTFNAKQEYTILARVKDTDNLWSVWSDPFVISTSKNKSVNNNLYFKLLEQFPMLSKLLPIFTRLLNLQ